MSLEPRHADVAIVGSGFSGVAMAARLRRSGRRDFVVLERAGEVGGTWRDNTYPGCVCDVPSHLYSFSFAPNPDWSATFAPQAEIQAYVCRVAEAEGVLPHVRFGCDVEDAAWDEAAALWRLRTSRGPLTARVLIAAPGGLSEPSLPDIPGLAEFEGTLFHSAAWDHGHELAGERVAVVGTGASAIQIVPAVQPAVARLHVFQRTAPWIMPRRDRPMTRAERRLFRAFPAAQRAVRGAIRWARELFALPMLHVRLSRVTARAALRHLEHQVPDPALRARLTPRYAPGCKRILLSNDYLPALGRPNVELVTAAIREVRGRAIVTADRTEREVDAIVLATGFHVTDLPIAAHVRDGDGRTLDEHWDGGPEAHRGTMVAGFPNLFFLLGPNTGLGHTSVLLMAEAQVGYVLGALDAMDARGARSAEPLPAAQRAWNDAVQRRMQGTVWTEGGCASWYLDAHGRNTTLWPGMTPGFERALRRFRVEEHRLLPAPAPAPGPEPVTAGA